MAAHPAYLHTVLDGERPRELAEFYRQLLGLVYRPGDEAPTDGSPDDADWLVLTRPSSGSTAPTTRSRSTSSPTPRVIRSASSSVD